MRCPDYTCRTLEGCDATCGDGLKYCEVWNNCYDPMWEVCPELRGRDAVLLSPERELHCFRRRVRHVLSGGVPALLRFAGVRLLLLGAVVAQFGGR